MKLSKFAFVKVAILAGVGTAAAQTTTTTTTTTSTATTGTVGPNDFTQVGTAGFCTDKNGVPFYEYDSPDFPYLSDADTKAFCINYCSQNINADFRGMAYKNLTRTSEYICYCLFDMPFEVGSANKQGVQPKVVYYYSPAAYDSYGYSGTGEITGTDDDPDTICYKYTGPTSTTTTSTTSSTGAVNPAEFSLVGNGSCRDSKDDEFTYVSSPLMLWQNINEAFSTCTKYCGQNIHGDFRGMAIYNNRDPTKYECDCLWDMGLTAPKNDDDDVFRATFPYVYTPNPEYGEIDKGTGEIVTVYALADIYCYRYTAITTTTTSSTTTKAATTTTKAATTTTKAATTTTKAATTTTKAATTTTKAATTTTKAATTTTKAATTSTKAATTTTKAASTTTKAATTTTKASSTTQPPPVCDGGLAQACTSHEDCVLSQVFGTHCIDGCCGHMGASGKSGKESKSNSKAPKSNSKAAKDGKSSKRV